MGGHKPLRTHRSTTPPHTTTSPIPRATSTHGHRPVGQYVTTRTNPYYDEHNRSQPLEKHRHHHSKTTHPHTSKKTGTHDYKPLRASHQTHNPANTLPLYHTSNQCWLHTHKTPCTELQPHIQEWLGPIITLDGPPYGSRATRTTRCCQNIASNLPT